MDVIDQHLAASRQTLAPGTLGAYDAAARKLLGTRNAGTTIPVTKLGELAHAWWGDRIDTNWQPRNRAQNLAILNDLGLTDPFWSLSEAVGSPTKLPPSRSP